MKSINLIVLAALALTTVASALPLSIENETLQAAFDSGSLTLRAKASDKAFATSDGLVGKAWITTVENPTFGTGQQIEFTRPNGDHDSIMLFPNLPFVLLRSTLHNPGSEAVTTNKVRMIPFQLNLEAPLSDLRTLGTGGLLAPKSNPGSYAYLALVNPASRAGVVGGWLTHDRGSGVVFSPVAQGEVRFAPQIDYGNLRLKPGADTELETFALGWFDDARLGLEAYADAIATHYAIQLPPQPSGYCTWYMEKHNHACDEKHLVELMAVAEKQLRPFGFDFVQIDDYWQAGISTNGPKRNFTTNRADGPYPGGMKAAADSIRQFGFTPGIWFMPFAGTSYDPFFADHQDWFAQTSDGEPFEARWGGTCLDMTQPGAREYVRSVVNRIAHQWGYTLFKLDGLWTGSATRITYVNDGYKDDHIGEALLHDPDKTHIEAYRDGLKLVRQTAGTNVFLLGCCVSQNMRSFGGAFGLVDAMRVGPDTGAGHIGAPHASRNYFLQGRVWINDPDCVSVRARTSLNQARVNASFTAIAGDLFYNSDWIPDLPEERLDILRRCMPAHGLRPRPVDLFEQEPARIWLLTDTRQSVRRDVVALYNWEKTNALTITCTADRLGLPPAEEYVAFDFWANEFLPPFQQTFSAELPQASCRVLAVKPVSDHPQLLSTSRHITQGMVDVTDEHWDASQQTLSGRSRVVANDPYELRIVVPAGTKSWLAKTVTASAEDSAADVKATFQQDGTAVRATLRSPVSREVRWQIHFTATR